VAADVQDVRPDVAVVEAEDVEDVAGKPSGGFEHPGEPIPRHVRRL